ncbi:LexA-like protein [Microcystis phage Mwe-JY08]
MSSIDVMGADCTFRGARRQGETYSTFRYVSDMEEIFERLQKARRRAGYEDATAAARARGWNENTYRSHENGARGLKPDVARQYAKAFKVSPGWLLTGDGPVDRQNIVSVVGRIGAGAEITPDEEQVPPEGLFEIEAPFPVPDDALAFEVVGDSMWPRYDPGDVIVCFRHQSPIDNVLGMEAAVKTAEGGRYLKRVLRGSAPKTFDLESHNAPPMRGVRLEWVSSVQAVIRRGQWSVAANSR